MLTAELTAESVAERISALNAEVGRLADVRQAVIDKFRAELALTGSDVIRVGGFHGRRQCTDRCHHETWEIGDEGYATDFVTDDGRRCQSVYKTAIDRLPARSRRGCAWVTRGRYRLALIDDTEGWSEYRVFVRVADVEHSDDEHRKMVANLRGAARREGLRVSVRDLEVSLLDPMDSLVYRGDVIGAFRWLFGIDAPGGAA